MPNDPAQAVRRVCIVIFTYPRNAELLRVARQCREIIQNYRGHNHYELCVSDSDPANPIAPLPAEWNARYLTNPGKGFDDNIYHF